MSSERKLALIVIAVSGIGWGIPLLLFPGVLFDDIAGAEYTRAAFYSRYSGAWLLAPGCAAVQVLRSKFNGDALLFAVAISAGLSAVALAADFFLDETPVAAWFVWLAIVDAAAMSLLSARALRSAPAA